ncbi:hypothetical protein D3C72_1316700 [compost metagenome]
MTAWSRNRCVATRPPSAASPQQRARADPPARQHHLRDHRRGGPLRDRRSLPHRLWRRPRRGRHRGRRQRACVNRAVRGGGQRAAPGPEPLRRHRRQIPQHGAAGLDAAAPGHRHARLHQHGHRLRRLRAGAGLWRGCRGRRVQHGLRRLRRGHHAREHAAARAARSQRPERAAELQQAGGADQHQFLGGGVPLLEPRLPGTCRCHVVARAG